MSDWLNMVAINVARNGTTSHTVNPASTGTVVAGAPFTPTAGRLLVAVVEGAVTSTTPSGWTLPIGGSAINNTGLYVWYRTAAGSDTIATTHNGSNYPIVVTFFEFAAGSSFVASVSGIGYSPTAGANPNLTGLSGTNWLGAAKASGLSSGSTYTSSAWSASGASPVKIVDTSAAYSSTDGYAFTLAELNASTLPAYQPLANMTGGFPSNCEAITLAVNVASGGGSSTYPVSGTVAATSAASGAPTLRATVAGTAAGVSAVTAGAPTAMVAMTGTIAPVAGTSGATGLLAGASGLAAATSSSAGAPTGLFAASGHVDAVTTVSGSPSSPGNSLSISGTVAATSGAAGAVTALLAAAGSAAGASTAAGAVSGRLAVSGSTVGSTSASGTPTLRATAAGTSAATSTTVGAPSLVAKVSGVVAAVSASAGALSNPSEYQDITVVIGEPYGNALTIGTPEANPLRVGDPIGHPLIIGPPRS